MKKKHLNILLIIVVLGIWGKLIYNYSKRFAQPVISQQNNYNYKPLLKVKKKEFSLNKLQRDPFLNKLTQKRVSKKNKTRAVKKTKKILNFKWPKINYLGYIKSQVSTNKLAILKVDGKIKNCKQYSYFNKNIYIRNIFKDSIQLEINNQFKTIKK